MVVVYMGAVLIPFFITGQSNITVCLQVIHYYACFKFLFVCFVVSGHYS